ncbi:MAG TPA: DUF5335 family protein [Pyrinomonadaceae bacterium]|nr:DUF5335 family protein [Pyrinomonadaceae bacterium]
MSTQEIPRNQWNTFFDSFSRQHEGWLATLELLSTDLGAQEEANELSFEGISLNADDADSEAIVISLARTPADHVTHMIDHPKHVWLERTEEGADSSLEIESEADEKALLRFRSPVRPEFVDGIV